MHVLLVLELVAFTPQPRVGTMVSALVPPLARVSMSANAPSGDQENPMKKLISDLKFLGPLRFVVQGNGAILESVAEVGSVSYKVRKTHNPGLPRAACSAVFALPMTLAP